MIGMLRGKATTPVCLARDMKAFLVDVSPLHKKFQIGNIK